MIKYTLVLTLLLAACGGRSSNSGSSTTVTLEPAKQILLQALNTVRTASSNNPATIVADKYYEVDIPQPSELAVIQNTSEFYHVQLTLGSVVCDYVHQATQPGFVWGSGCTTASSFAPVNGGQNISLEITSTVSQSTVIHLTATLRY